ncbi:sciellin isoform 1-T1 [Leptodactylus fuscus]|uniref:sciellin n=1 Tax=Leptodactylus fuscus TaxID=238119 RepID=UPI003F4ECCAF
MSSYSYNRTGNDQKSNTLGSMNRQNVIQETNKRRTLLNDNSWIKKRPEEEEIKDENFGKAVLNRYKSQEDLDSSVDKEEKKPIHNRFRSDDALDRIPSRNTFEGGNKAATLERVPMSGPEATNKSRQSWAPSNKTTTTTTTTTTEESKRKSWAPTNRNSTTTTTTTTTETKQVVPGKPEGQKITIFTSDTRTTDKQPKASFVDSARTRFEKPDEKPSPPTSPRAQNVDEKPKLPPRSPIAKTDDRPPYPSKPVAAETGERRSAVERKQRSQDIDNLIEVSSSKVVSNKSTQDVDNLIDIKPTIDKGKRKDQLDDFIEISNTAKNFNRKDDSLDNLIEIKKPDANPRTQNLDNLIDIKTTTVNKGNQNLDNLIDIKNTTTTVNKGSQDLDDLIAITGDGNKGTTRPASNSTNVTNRSSTTTTTYNVKEGTSDAPNRRPTTTTAYNVKEGPNNTSSTRSTTTTTYNVTEETNDVPNRRSTTTSKVTEYHDMPREPSTTSRTYKTDDSYDAPTRRSTTSYKDSTDGPNVHSNVTVTQETRYSSLPDSTYGDSRKSSSSTYGQNIISNSIKTVYSTSDHSVMEKDICTYCRKPLGIDAKMILKDLNICCHATCFKCEACSGSLGNLKAGDSMWIYKQTIHCEPCYFNAREKWII